MGRTAKKAEDKSYAMRLTDEVASFLESLDAEEKFISGRVGGGVRSIVKELMEKGVYKLPSNKKVKAK